MRRSTAAEMACLSPMRLSLPSTAVGLGAFWVHSQFTQVNNGVCLKKRGRASGPRQSKLRAKQSGMLLSAYIMQIDRFALFWHTHIILILIAAEEKSYAVMLTPATGNLTQLTLPAFEIFSWSPFMPLFATTEGGI